MEPYLGEIRIFGGLFAPVGWLFCQGQLLSIAENEALFSLLGTLYGGDGHELFAVPNIASRVVVGQGQAPGLSNYVIGQLLGSENVTLSSPQLPTHAHPFSGTLSVATGGNAQTSPDNAYFGDKGSSAYVNAAGTATLANGVIVGQSSVAGGSQPHSNIQPVMALNYIICTAGIYPMQP